MNALGERLYFPGMSETRVLFHGGTATALGTVRVIAEQIDGRGVPSSPMRVFGSYALVLITRGGGRYRDAVGARRELLAGDAILVLPDVGHTYGPGPGQRWDEIFVTFEGTLFDGLRASGVLRPDCLVWRPPAAWRERFGIFANGPAPGVGADRLRQVSELHALLVDLVAEESPASASDPWLEQAKALLDEGLERPLELGRVAERMGLAAETFRRRFAQSAGVPPARYRATRRIEAAANLLRQTTMTHRQISESLGFTDEFHFAKRFKSAMGVTPRDFRQGSPAESASRDMLD
jgi:AraC-like DNA-binding protein